MEREYFVCWSYWSYILIIWSNNIWSNNKWYDWQSLLCTYWRCITRSLTAEFNVFDCLVCVPANMAVLPLVVQSSLSEQWNYAIDWIDVTTLASWLCDYDDDDDDIMYFWEFIGTAAALSSYVVCSTTESNNKLRREPRYMPPPLHTVRPSSSPYTPYARGVQRALLPVAVGAMNIHAICDRQTDRRQTASLLNAPRLGGGRGRNNDDDDFLSHPYLWICDADAEAAEGGLPDISSSAVRGPRWQRSRKQPVYLLCSKHCTSLSLSLSLSLSVCPPVMLYTSMPLASVDRV